MSLLSLLLLPRRPLDADDADAAEAAFKELAMTAAEWVPLHECRAADMARYIAARRAQGYAIVGLEQTAHSVPLERAVLPDRVVLVLGAELLGVPASILPEFDLVVEIPQFGVVRSMNVHVSAALLIWEYTRQRILRTGAPPP